MSVIVSINGTDRSQFIEWPSLRVEQRVTSQVDSATFRVKKYGDRTYAPQINDTVLISDGGTNIFGGVITSIQNQGESTMSFYSVSAVSYERYLDRYLVIREFTNVPARHVLNTIMSDFVNRVAKAIDSGESTETWTQEDGTVAATTTQGEFVYGSQARKFTATSSSTATARAASALDLSVFDNGSAFTDDDYVRLMIKIDNIDNLTSLRIRFVDDSGATYTNYFEYTILAAALQNGWQEVTIAKDDFAATGSPSWSGNAKRQYRVTASAAGTVNVVIDDVRTVQVSTFFSQSGVMDADQVVGSVKFNYEQVSDAFKQVAEAIGNDWYISPTRDLYFFAPETLAAPFNLTDSSQNFDWNSLEYAQDITTLKNQIYVRGGEYEGATTTYSVTADGVAVAYRSPYRMKNVTVTVNAVSQSVGVDNLDDPDAFDCLYNFQEKTLKFKTGTIPANGHAVAITGTPMIPVIVKRGDSTSIAQYGVYEHVIIDKSITTQQGARDRAAAELRNYRNALIEGSFNTDTSGLRAGQTIDINVTARGINESFIVQSVKFRMKSPTQVKYEIGIVTTRSAGIIEYLMSLLRNERKQIVINDNEVVDLVQDINETVTVTDSWSVGSANEQTEQVDISDTDQNELDKTVQFVLTPYTPSGFADSKRPFILGGSLLA